MYPYWIYRLHNPRRIDTVWDETSVIAPGISLPSTEAMEGKMRFKKLIPIAL